MNEGERAGRWAVVYLLMVGAAAYFTIFMIVFSFVKTFSDLNYEQTTIY